jgi:hypothetical protein
MDEKRIEAEKAASERARQELEDLELPEEGAAQIKGGADDVQPSESISLNFKK